MSRRRQRWMCAWSPEAPPAFGSSGLDWLAGLAQPGNESDRPRPGAVHGFFPHVWGIRALLLTEIDWQSGLCARNKICSGGRADNLSHDDVGKTANFIGAATYESHTCHPTNYRHAFLVPTGPLLIAWPQLLRESGAPGRFGLPKVQFLVKPCLGPFRKFFNAPRPLTPLSPAERSHEVSQPHNLPACQHFKQFRTRHSNSSAYSPFPSSARFSPSSFRLPFRASTLDFPRPHQGPRFLGFEAPT